MTEYYLIAQIQSAKGKEGFLAITPFSDFRERYSRLEKVYLDFFGEKKLFIIDKVKYDSKSILIRFKNFENPGDADFLIGKEIYIDEGGLMPLPDDHFYIHDLIDSEVYKNDTLFGKIKDVYSLKSNDVLVIEQIDAEEYLLPLLKEYILSFDAEKKIMILKPGDEYYANED